MTSGCVGLMEFHPKHLIGLFDPIAAVGRAAVGGGAADIHEIIQ